MVIRVQELRNIETNDNVLYIHCLDNVDRDNIVDFVNRLNEEKLNRKEVDITTEEASVIGEKYVVPGGTLYKGSLIKDVYEAFGIEGICDILRASPRKDGSEDKELHDAPLTQVIPLVEDAWGYLVCYIVTVMDEQEWEYLRSFLKLSDGSTHEDITTAISYAFANLACEYVNLEDSGKYAIKLPSYNGKNIKQVFEESGEKGIYKMMSEAVKVLDDEVYAIAATFLDELHQFPGFANLEEVAKLLSIKDVQDPKQIAKICSERMNAKLNSIIKQKNSANNPE